MRDSFEPLRGQRVLVTGGLGFIGRNLTTFLTEQLQCRVTVLDDLSNVSDSPPEHAGVTVQIGDVRDEATFAPLLREHPYVFHLACRNIFFCGDDPESDLTVNAGSTLKMLEFLRKERPAGLQRFVYTSSTSIYGNARHIPSDELDPPNILNHYAATKLLGEHYTMLYHTSFRVPTACVRYSNVFGPWQTARNPYCGVPGKFLDLALAGSPLTIHGDGEQTRDYTYVDDAIEATVLAAVAPQAIGDVFNVGTGIETTVNTLAREINALFANSLEITYVEKRGIDNIRRRALNPEKARLRLGWAPSTGLAEGLRRTLAWRRAS